LGDHTLCHFIINPLDFAMAAECASLLTLNLAMLRDHDEAEENRLLSACKAAGVFYLSFEGSGETVNQTAVDGMLRCGHKFFNLPIEQKSTVSWAQTGTYFGYKALGGAVVDQDGTPDSNEFLNVRRHALNQ
jgi:isopenicillin N synthase-like dioxygenase